MIGDTPSASISLLDLKDNTSSTFEGFKDVFNFQACVSVLSTFGLLGVFFASLPICISSLLSVFFISSLYTWFKIHGARITRREHVFFDVRNLLEIAPNFEYEYSKMSDDCLTPGPGQPQKELPGPQSIWEALFADEEKLRMEQFYREHYGPVYRTGQKQLKEYEMQKKAEQSQSVRSAGGEEQIKTAEKREN